VGTVRTRRRRRWRRCGREDDREALGHSRGGLCHGTYSASGDQGHQSTSEAPRDSGDASARKAGPPASIAIVQGRLIATAASGQRHQLYCYSNLTRSSLSSLPSSPELRLVRIHQLCETRRCILRLNPRLIVRIQCVRDLGYYTWYQSHRSTKIATTIHQNPHQNSPKKFEI
jgi:hypothetical protein